MSLIGLDQNKSEKIAAKLNVLLSDLEIYYQNLRGFHWNVKGNKFFVLHDKFEELYDEAAGDIDEVAERVLTLGFQPLHSYADFIDNARLKAVKNVSDGDETCKHVLSNLTALIELEREILELADDASDEGTQALVGDLIAKQEKTVWMFNAWLS
ncbi:MAG: DNA starvation/stationary phase protection protein [Cyclobacteriaceae bacterium]|nr:DNA starvation/stationary phase protection protein [Cyclobacteriaceae bacterium]MCH8516453.1 DNA starvation/stationary phase protection protein [Cyclobacteriaceae bacterium]